MTSSDYGMVSVIIPVYNTDKEYVTHCIESIKCQSYNRVEVLIIDDGSDKITAEFCKSLSETGFIRVFRTRNKGVSSARNTGIREAQGDYVMFIDADDAISNFAIEQLINSAAENKADIVIAKYAEIEKDLSSSTGSIASLHPKDAIKKLLYDDGVSAACFAKLYRRPIARKVLFNEELAFAEDLDFNYRFLKEVSSVGYLDSMLYYYRQNPEGVMRSEFKNSRIDGLSAAKFIIYDIDVEMKKPAAHRYFLEAMYVGSKVLDSGTALDKRKVLLVCSSAIVKTRSTVLRNGESALYIRALALISCINPVWSIKIYYLKMTAKGQI